MNYHYCQFCFKKTAQGSDIVKFCAHCGKSFNEITSSNQASINKSVISPFISESQVDKNQGNNRETYRKLLAKRGISVDDDDDDDETDNDSDISVPSISKLQIEVDIPQDVGVPMRALARSSKKEPRLNNNKTKIVKVNKKKFLEEYLKSASAIRPKK